MIPHDRRNAARFDTSSLVSHSDAEAPQATPFGLGVTLDLNEFGLRVQHADAFSVGDRFRFHIALGDDMIDAVGRVVHVARALNGTYEAGIEFLEVSPGAVESIRKHCLSRPKPF
jgi:c-di-GMP-binding flagellar brake protein YcgR